MDWVRVSRQGDLIGPIDMRVDRSNPNGHAWPRIYLDYERALVMTDYERALERAEIGVGRAVFLGLGIMLALLILLITLPDG